MESIGNDTNSDNVTSIKGHPDPLVDRLQIPLATFNHKGDAAHWSISPSKRPHCLVSGAGGFGKTVLLRSIANNLRAHPVGTLFIGWRPEECIPAHTSVICGTRTGPDIDGLHRAAQALRDIADTVTSNRPATPTPFLDGRPAPLVIIIDDAQLIFASWKHHCGDGSTKRADGADPQRSLNRILANRHRKDVAVCLSVQSISRSLHRVCPTEGSLRNAFGTRCAFGPQSAAEAQQLWGGLPRRDHILGRTDIGQVLIASPATPAAAPATVSAS